MKGIHTPYSTTRLHQELIALGYMVEDSSYQYDTLDSLTVHHIFRIYIRPNGTFLIARVDENSEIVDDVQLDVIYYKSDILVFLATWHRYITLPDFLKDGLIKIKSTIKDRK